MYLKESCENSIPAQALLCSCQYQEFEKGSVVVQRNTRLSVVVSRSFSFSHSSPMFYSKDSPKLLSLLRGIF